MTRNLAKAGYRANITEARTFLSMQKAAREADDLDQFAALDHNPPSPL